ncbi:Acetyltransferase (GNAT) family protein [Amycolatopsis marina]|uniref:Acetyltransferase (GNAT) family protein n=1 Tax=Amycolatopsis marina TaxID=490629 RepID=A0A1I1BPT4_9PSEU|nr:GNAT family N-acetyltransferase [Amycolatopsis marina]SFB51832.1 Acetyltransferase (GNAT) family protein [Amycolatopsis marina]
MPDTTTLEFACAEAWPPLVREPLGQWWLRAAESFTGRANSALAMGDPGLPIARALEVVCEFAHSHAVEPMVQAVHGSAQETALADEGWVPHVHYAAGHDVSVLLGPLPPAPAAAPALSVLDEPTDAWWSLVAGSTEPTRAQRHVLAAPGTGFGVAEADGTTVGAVRLAPARGLLHVGRLEVRPEHRRRGFAGALLGAGGDWARERDLTACVLQVSVRNHAALALYARLGFTEHHRYRYWVPRRGDAHP